MAITEVFGEFRTGKTQLSHTLCVTSQIPRANGYTGGKVIFLDTEHTLYPLYYTCLRQFDINLSIHTVKLHYECG